jgi:hypothetical protein
MNDFRNRRMHARSNCIALAPQAAIRCAGFSRKPMAVLDVSLRGARVEIKTRWVYYLLMLRKIIGLDGLIPADLIVENRIVASLKIKIAYVSKTEFGLQLTYSTRAAHEVLGQTFFPEFQAATMKQVPPTEGSLRLSNVNMEFFEFYFQNGRLSFIKVGLYSQSSLSPNKMISYDITGYGSNNDFDSTAARNLMRYLRNLPGLNEELVESAIGLVEKDLTRSCIPQAA